MSTAGERDTALVRALSGIESIIGAGYDSSRDAKIDGAGIDNVEVHPDGLVVEPADGGRSTSPATGSAADMAASDLQPAELRALAKAVKTTQTPGVGWRAEQVVKQ